MTSIRTAVAVMSATVLVGAPAFADTSTIQQINVVNELGGPAPNTSEWGAVSGALNDALGAKLAGLQSPHGNILEVRITGLRVAAAGPSELTARVLLEEPAFTAAGSGDTIPSVTQAYDVNVQASGGMAAPRDLANSVANYVAAHL
ncbi:hypothetical protein [Solirhodobacter olei]|uniref:hypothetical protein n=1 Tax=Solirhodobacter olei TaxID=2493082 RepID=UPI000FD96260|nr:hypothetical protein [Solirhodobacter olei]